MKSYPPGVGGDSAANYGDELSDLLSTIKATHAVETGTYLGGSAHTILNAMPSLETLTTIEVNWEFWKTAKLSLATDPRAVCWWGLSVPLGEAIDFVKNDPVLLDPERWPHVYADELGRSVPVYVAELRGEWFAGENRGGLEFESDYDKNNQGEDLLRKALLDVRDEKPFIHLDSCGGCGLVEYRIVREVMGGRPFWILLDDVRHLKHFRSIAALVEDERATILRVTGGPHAWALAEVASL